jgi:hypothetical protein
MLRAIRAKLGFSTIDHAFCDSVRAFPWFSRCGLAPTFDIPLPAQPIHTWSEAVAALSATHWTNTTIDARNAFTAYLHKRFNRQFQFWNRITGEAKGQCVEPLSVEIWRPFAMSRNANDALVHSIQWTVLAALMEHEYRACRGAPKFFLHLLDVYRDGHIPCGWEGAWPSGKLLVH